MTVPLDSACPEPDWAGLTLEVTGDGSTTFFSEEFGEWFHCRSGAYSDAQKNYVEAARVAALAQAEQLTLLDVCYGLGYNTAAALETIFQINPHCRVTLRALEINQVVPQAAIAHGLLDRWSPPVQDILTCLVDGTPYRRNGLDLQLLFGDARQTIQPLATRSWQADAILFDPFSPTRCPQLWTVEFFERVSRCLSDQGVLATYSCAAAVRAAMQLAGLYIRSIPGVGRTWPCTIATKQPMSPNLSQQEQEHLRTRAAIPYRDPTLTATADAIRHRRQQEQQQSSLEATGAWRRRRLGR